MNTDVKLNMFTNQLREAAWIKMRNTQRSLVGQWCIHRAAGCRAFSILLFYTSLPVTMQSVTSVCKHLSC